MTQRPSSPPKDKSSCIGVKAAQKTRKALESRLGGYAGAHMSRGSTVQQAEGTHCVSTTSFWNTTMNATHGLTSGTFGLGEGQGEVPRVTGPFSQSAEWDPCIVNLRSELSANLSALGPGGETPTKGNRGQGIQRLRSHEGKRQTQLRKRLDQLRTEKCTLC